MDIHEKVLNAFQAEHKEQLAGIRSILSSIERSARTAQDPRWTDAFRMAHTLKGGARVCALPPIETVGHRMESLFASVRDGNVAFTDHVAEVAFRALDIIEDWMAALAAGKSPPDPAESLAAIEQILEHRPTPGQASLVQSPVTPNPSEAAVTPALGLPDFDSVRIPIKHLDLMLRSSDSLANAETEILQAATESERLSAQMRSLLQMCDGVRQLAGPLARQSEYTRELAAVFRQVEQISRHARRIGQQHRSVCSLQQRGVWALRLASDNLRHAVLQTRLIGAENVLGSLGPMVRSLARELRKEVEFRAIGLETLADRMVLQAIKDPLVHALRNAVVHGIEEPSIRMEAGKDRTGHIALTLSVKGNRLVATVEDDGRGIDMARVAGEACRRGFTTSAECESDPDGQTLCQLLFQPGFSTCSDVNELAGRGMGLSVVQNTVSRLRGSVRIGPRSAGGTTLEISSPLVIATEQLLLVACAGQTLALPIHGIDRLLRLKVTEIQKVDGHDLVVLGDEPLQIIRMAELLGFPQQKARCTGDVLSVVVLRRESGHVGVVVDRFIREREALIRELDEYASSVNSCICGAILLEDSEAALVIDPVALAKHRVIRSTSSSKQLPDKSPSTSRILVVDDSFTTRTLEKCILETHGFDVRLAVDGVEALAFLRSEPVDVVIADVQMPRMDGLALLQEMRRDPRFSSLPVILVTSLDRPEDRKRGLEFGANAYIVKRKFDHQDLLDTIRRFL